MVGGGGGGGGGAGCSFNREIDIPLCIQINLRNLRILIKDVRPDNYHYHVYT